MKSMKRLRNKSLRSITMTSSTTASKSTARLEEKKMIENLKREIIALKELKEKEVETIFLEKEELKARVELLSKSLKEMEDNKLKEGHKVFISEENFKKAARALEECSGYLADKEKEVKSALLEKEELKARLDVLSKSFEENMADKEKEVQSILLEKEELKARVEVLSTLLSEFKHDRNSGNNVEDVNKLSLSFENLASAPSHDTGTKQTSFNQTVPYSRNPLFPLKSNTSPFSDKYHTGTKQIPLFSFKSNMPPFVDKYPGNANQILSLELSSTSEMHHAGTKQKPLCNQENGPAHMSSKLTGPHSLNTLFPLKSNTPPFSDKNSDNANTILSLERKSTTSSTSETHNTEEKWLCNQENGSRNPLFPLKSNRPPFSDKNSDNANQTLSLERKSTTSSTSEIHNTGTKEKCSFNQENGSAHMSFKQTDPYSRNPLFPLKSNTPPVSDTKLNNANQILSLERKSTMTSTSEMHHAGTKNVSASALGFPDPIIPLGEPVHSRSLESKSSSKVICTEAELAHIIYPYNNFPTPGASEEFPEPVSFCEECKEVHETYYYCIKKPCSACNSKDHHIGTCPYFHFIPQGVDFNRDVYEVVCACHSPFYQDQWYCSSCPGTSIGTRLKAKYCLICKSIGHHSCYECPEDKVRADVFRSDRNAHFISTKLSLHERIPKPVDLNKDARKRLQYLI